LVLGKHSGMRGLDARCRAIGHRLGETELERVYRRVTELADRSKTVSDEQLAAIIRDEAGRTMIGSTPRVAPAARAQGAAWR
jgi:2-isopropylmalate synthase